MIIWTHETDEIAALTAMRAIFAAAAETLHAVTAEAGEISPAGGHDPMPR